MEKYNGLGSLLLESINRKIPIIRNHWPENTPPQNWNFSPLTVHLTYLIQQPKIASATTFLLNQIKIQEVILREIFYKYGRRKTIWCKNLSIPKRGRLFASPSISETALEITITTTSNDFENSMVDCSPCIKCLSSLKINYVKLGARAQVMIGMDQRHWWGGGGSHRQCAAACSQFQMTNVAT